jgi:hypothetical protein
MLKQRNACRETMQQWYGVTPCVTEVVSVDLGAGSLAFRGIPGLGINIICTIRIGIAQILESMI